MGNNIKSNKYSVINLTKDENKSPHKAIKHHRDGLKN